MDNRIEHNYTLITKFLHRRKASRACIGYTCCLQLKILFMLSNKFNVKLIEVFFILKKLLIEVLPYAI